MAMPDLFQSPATQVDLTKFGPSHWNTVTEFLEDLFGGADADGTVLTRDSASPLGATWEAPSGGSGLPTLAAGVLMTSGSPLAAGWTETPTLAGLTMGGAISFSPDNTYDIGASAANRPRNIYLAGSVQATQGVNAASAAWIWWTSRSVIQAPAAGVIQLSNAAATDFSRLQFGGTTSSFPALKRSGANVHIRLADDSGYTNLQAENITTSLDMIVGNAIRIGTNPAAAGSVRIPNNGFVAARNAGNTTEFNVLGVDSNNITRVGSPSAITTVRSTLAAPGTISDGDWWLECTGTSPSRVMALKGRDGGVTRTVASITY